MSKAFTDKENLPVANGKKEEKEDIIYELYSSIKNAKQLCSNE